MTGIEVIPTRTDTAFARTINQLKGKVTVRFIAHQVPKASMADGVVRLSQTAAAKGNS